MLTAYRGLCLTVASVWVIFFQEANSENCVKISDCAFTCSDITYDLSSIGSKTGLPKFKDAMPVVGDNFYSYNPCYPFTETEPGAFEDECKNVASCQKISDGGAGSLSRFYDCGVQSSVTFQRLPGNQISALIDSPDLFLVATYVAGVGGRSTKVLFSCAETESFSAIGEDVNVPTVYVYLLQTPNACEPGSAGLSVGSILLIIVLIVMPYKLTG